MGASNKGEVHPIDKIIGANLARIRNLRGMSMEKLGGDLSRPITFQQIQKYERGYNRVSGSVLAEFAHLLECRVADFFEGVEVYFGNTAAPVEVKPLELDRKDAILLRNYHLLSPTLQEVVREMISGLTSELANILTGKGGRHDSIRKSK